MDFRLDEDCRELQGLTRDILTDLATGERIREVERGAGRIDERLWRQLAEAGVLGAAIPERYGGTGTGLGGLCCVLEEQGRFVAPAPLWPAALAGMAVAAYGTEEQRMRLLPGTADGSVRFTVALEEFGAAVPSAPTCAAKPDGRRWLLYGTKAAVPAPFGADGVLVSAGTEHGPGLFLVAPGGTGIGWERAETTTREWSGNLTLDGAAGEAVGAPGGGVLPWTLGRTWVALAALQLGVAEGALRLAASYLSRRHQFGRPLATFQAVQHQLADCWIDIDAMRVTLWHAATALRYGAGERRAVLVARSWADQAGLDVVHRAQHLHGGIGVDVDYPMHRYLLWGKQIAGTLGGSAAALADLGAVLAGEEVTS